MSEVPGVKGRIGLPEERLISQWEEYGGTFPPRPVYNERDEITQWMRYLSESIPVADLEGATSLDEIRTIFENIVLHNYRLPTFHKPSELDKLTDYRIRVAPHREFMDVNSEGDYARLIQVTDHVQGIELWDYLISADISTGTKTTLCDNLYRQLSAYARDKGLAILRDQKNEGFLFDIARPEQFIVDDASGIPTLVDTEAFSGQLEDTVITFYKYYANIMERFRQMYFISEDTAQQLYDDFTSVKPYLGPDIPIDSLGELRDDLTTVVNNGFEAMLAGKVKFTERDHRELDFSWF